MIEATIQYTRVQYSCGHEEMVRADSDWLRSEVFQVFAKDTGRCRVCSIAAAKRVNDYLRKVAEQSAPKVVDGLTELKGSPKQIEWATRIRDKAAALWFFSMKINCDSPYLEIMQIMHDTIFAQNDAQFWIKSAKQRKWYVSRSVEYPNFVASEALLAAGKTKSASIEEKIEAAKQWRVPSFPF